MFFSLLSQWLRAPFTHYRLFHNFVRQDFTGQFAGSLGGKLWLFVTPIVNILIYSFMFSVVFRAPMPAEYDGIPFVVFMMMGYLPWFAFADAVGRASTMLLEKAPLITKVMFPVQIIPAVGTLVPYMVHGIALGLFLFYLALQSYFSLLWLWLPLIFLFQFLFTMGLVAILSALCVFLRDVQQIVALALTTFATWRPARVLLGAYLFGGVTMLQFHLQGVGVQVPSQLLTALPYIATIVVLALISRNPTWIRVNMPASLGKPFYPGS